MNIKARGTSRRKPSATGGKSDRGRGRRGASYQTLHHAASVNGQVVLNRDDRRQTIQNQMVGLFGSFWGLAGVSLLIGSAIYRLAPVALEAFSHEFLWYHWLSLVFVSLFMAYAEGYRGFQQGFSPRVAARARYLKNHPNTRDAILGPFFCMGYFQATRRRKITSISLTVGIVLLILLVRLVPQPWRGLVDVGVVIGLVWGLISILWFALRAFSSDQFEYSPEVPDSGGPRNRMFS